MRKFLFLVLIIVLAAAYWFHSNQEALPLSGPSATNPAAKKVPNWKLPFRQPTAVENAQARKIVVRIDGQVKGAALATICVLQPSHAKINSGATNKNSDMSVVESRLGRTDAEWVVTNQQIAIVSHPAAETLTPGITVAFRGVLGQPFAIPGGNQVPSASAFAVVPPGK